MDRFANDLLKKIKANQPEVLKADNDFLGTIPKGDMIKGFLDSLLDREDTDIQMIALYGEWGSGKTSLMKYIQSKLDEEPINFSTIFFESWKLENDENLALSLLDSIIKKNKGNVGVYKDKIWNSLKKITRSTISGVKTPFFDVGKSFDTARQEFENKSFSDAVKAFKDSYVELETAVLNDIDGENRKLVVFIDDLDRCEPENVLNLLSAIKLFFTYGKNTIFICGLDEKAVDEAVKVKYKEVVKSGEYMEKIFDISFDMPKPNINKMIAYYFEDMPAAIDGVQQFFEVMHFTNSRHIKKVLNKYLLLRYYQLSEIDKDGLIPDQNIEFFRYLTLFIIMLYKFEHEAFETIKNYENKLSYYFKVCVDKKENAAEYFMKYMVINPSEIKTITVNSIFNGKIYSNQLSTGIGRITLCEKYKGTSGQTKDRFMQEHAISMLVTLFAPKIDKFNTLVLNDFEIYRQQFYGEKTLLSRFCAFLETSRSQIPINNSEYVLWNIFDMAERYL